MRDKLVCVYRGHKFEDVAGVVSTICERVEDNPTIENLQKLCGALSYVSLFVIPDYDLITGKAYTVENSCYFVDGIIKLSYNAIVSGFYEITSMRVNIPDTLLKILLDCAFGETMTVLNLPMRDIYVALLRCYCSITNKEFKYNTDESWYYIQLAFTEEVKYLAD